MGKRKNNQQPVIGPRTRRNFTFLTALLDTRSPKQRWGIIQNASREELLAIVDICTNIKRSNFRINAKERKRMNRHLESMDRLSRARSEKSARAAIQSGEGIVVNPNARRKRDTLKVEQRGGFLPAFLAPVLLDLAAEVADHFIPDPDHR